MSGDVRIRLLDGPQELAALIQVFDRIWGPTGHTMMDVPALVALRAGGHFVSGLFVDNELVGGCIGFHVEPLGRTLHSHISGVLPAHAGAGLGRALKRHQRQWCRERGIDTIRWTFDPLISRNAHFNLTSLGAAPTAYAANYYGVMSDGINRGDESDRMTVSWRIDDDGSRTLGTLSADCDAGLLLKVNPEGHPTIDRSVLAGAMVALQIPTDIERMRLESPSLARSWRLALREALSPLLGSEDWTPLGFSQTGTYVFSRRSA